MAKASKQLFEVDRKMELRLRLAAKNAGSKGRKGMETLTLSKQPERELVHRVIKKVSVL